MKTFFKILLKFMVMVANLFLAPVNAIVVNAFPDLSNLVNMFNQFLNNFFADGLTYFFNLLPPHTKEFIVLYLTLLGILYTASLAIHAIIKVIEIIKAVKVW